MLGWGDSKPRQEAERKCVASFAMWYRESKDEYPHIDKHTMLSIWERAFIEGLAEACQQILNQYDRIELEDSFDAKQAGIYDAEGNDNEQS